MQVVSEDCSEDIFEHPSINARDVTRAFIRTVEQWQGVLDQAKTDASSADRGAANGKNYLTGVAPEHNGELLFVAMRADAPEIELCIERKRQHLLLLP